MGGKLLLLHDELPAGQVVLLPAGHTVVILPEAHNESPRDLLQVGRLFHEIGNELVALRPRGPKHTRLQLVHQTKIADVIRFDGDCLDRRLAQHFAPAAGAVVGARQFPNYCADPKNWARWNVSPRGWWM